MTAQPFNNSKRITNHTNTLDVHHPMLKTSQFLSFWITCCVCLVLRVVGQKATSNETESPSTSPYYHPVVPRCEGTEVWVEFPPFRTNTTTYEKVGVDWGEYSTLQFDSVYRHVENNSFVYTTHLPPWLPNATMAESTSYATDKNGNVTLIHKYMQPGTYFPIIRYGDWTFGDQYQSFTGSYPCGLLSPYGDFDSDCGTRDDQECDGEEHDHVVIDTNGNCSIVKLNVSAANITDKPTHLCIEIDPPKVPSPSGVKPVAPSGVKPSSPTSVAQMSFPVGYAVIVLTGLTGVFQVFA